MAGSSACAGDRECPQGQATDVGGGEGGIGGSYAIVYSCAISLSGGKGINHEFSSAQGFFIGFVACVGRE